MALREICVMWFQGNNSDHSRIYACIPFSLFTHVSSSPFLPFFLLPTPLRTPPQESNTFPLSSACFALAPLQGGKGCFPLQMRSGHHTKSGLAFMLVMSYTRGISSVRGFGGICHYNIPMSLFGTLFSDTEPISGVKFAPSLEFVSQGLCQTVMPQKVPRLICITGDLSSGLFACLKDGFPATPRHTTSNCDDICYVSSAEVSHRKIWAMFLWSPPILENCFIQEPFYRIPWRSLMNFIQNTNLCLKLRNVSQPLLHPANE